MVLHHRRLLGTRTPAANTRRPATANTDACHATTTKHTPPSTPQKNKDLAYDPWLLRQAQLPGRRASEGQALIQQLGLVPGQRIGAHTA